MSCFDLGQSHFPFQDVHAWLVACGKVLSKFQGHLHCWLAGPWTLTKTYEDLFHLACSRAHLRQLSVPQRRALQPMDILSPSALNRLECYNLRCQAFLRRRCRSEDLIYDLGDNPGTGWTTWSAVSGTLPMLRRSGSMLFAPHFGRQLLLRELFAGYGYPTFEPLAEASGVDVFS